MEANRAEPAGASGRTARPPTRVVATLPGWVAGELDWTRRYGTAEDRMRLPIRLARRNVELGTGGPFGAAIFESSSGALVAAGVNAVERMGNCVLHAEIMAIMLAQRRHRSHSLASPGLPDHELFTTCEPCAMCIGAALWSGVKRLICAATRDDAMAIGFDEGPVFPESYRYLERRGVNVVRRVLRAEAAAVLREYADRGGLIYTG
jgi:tRNA(Arg) A34 adenosine deaminase TadA